MTTVRIPLIGSPSNRGSSSTTDQRYVNCFPENVQNQPVSPQTGSVQQQFYLVKRDGFQLHSNPSGTTGVGRGIYAFNGKLYSVIGNKLYSNTTELHTLTTSTGLVGFTEFSAANDYLVLLDGTDGYYIDTANVVTKITDVDFPTPHIPAPVFMDEYLFVQKTTGEIFNSNAGDVTAWAATSFLTPESYPDGAVAICRQNNMLVALGTDSVEFFYDAANPVPGSPLGRNLQAILQYGCASAGSVATEEGLVLFVAQSATGENFVVAIEGTKDTTISTESIARILVSEGSNISSCVGYLTRQKGHLLYILTLASSGRTLVYDINTSMWHEWSWFDGVTESFFPMMDATELTNVEYMLHRTNGKIYKSSPTVYQDEGNAIKILIQTVRFDGGNANVKFMDRLEVIGDWQSGTSIVSISWSDDDYKTWSSTRTVDITDRAFLQRCGSFRRRAFKLLHSDNTDFRVAILEAWIRLGVH